MSAAVTSAPPAVRFGALDWSREGTSWPHASYSRFVAAGGLTWHVQIMGQGPVALLLHGTGASTHSWRALAPHLAHQFTLVMPDLPGHAYTSAPPSAAGLTLPGMARSTAALLEQLGLDPVLAIGHSAGAAVALAMANAGQIKPRGVIGLNAALLPFGGLAGLIFQPMARLLTLNPLMANILASRAQSRARVADTLVGTGSRLDDAGIDLYQRLFTAPRHVQSAIQMMAGWDLAPLVRALPVIATPVVLVVAGGDLAVPPDQGGIVADRMANARVVYLRDLGHLAHEEAPAMVAQTLLEIARPWASAAASPES